jgi:NADPH-dependent stearoyl-CoA 9-desaturase
MEIGHNVLHGQYDWMRDDELNSRDFDWDMIGPTELWKRLHNFGHHTYTNIIGKDRDLGYLILRITPEQRWNPYYLGNPIYAVVLSTVFQWGVMLHDLEVDRIVAGEKSWGEVWSDARKMTTQATRQLGKDYLLFPALFGPLAPLTFAANASANLVRNLWAFAIIFCGRFPAEVATFTEQEAVGESRGQWYVRQLLGSANITGSQLFHLLSGNLNHQIEHHLSPTSPPGATPTSPNRYATPATATACPTTPGHCEPNSAPSSANSPDWPCPAPPRHPRPTNRHLNTEPLNCWSPARTRPHSRTPGPYRDGRRRS